MSDPTESVVVDRRNPNEMQAAVTAGVVAGIKQMLADPEFVKSFWQRGFEELSTHTGNGATQWVGKRLLTIAITAMTTAGIVWLVKTGAIK